MFTSPYRILDEIMIEHDYMPSQQDAQQWHQLLTQELVSTRSKVLEKVTYFSSPLPYNSMLRLNKKLKSHHTIQSLSIIE